MRRIATIGAATAAALLISTPALAHVTVSPGEAATGGYARLDFRLPHGCDGVATNAMDVSIPAGVVSVKPEMVVGWDVTTEIGPYDEPVNLHGTEVTEGVQVITWTAQDGYELPDELFREFGVSLRMPDEGESVVFPVVQRCVDGSETAWIEVAEEGGEEPAHPAPVVSLTAGDDGHGDHGGDDATEMAMDDATAEPVAADADDASGEAEAAALAEPADDGTDPLTIVALVLAVLGLAVGGAGISMARRSS